MSEFDIINLSQGDRLITPKEVAERLGTSRGFVKKLLDSKMLPCIRFGRYARVSMFTFNKFIQTYQGEDIWELVERSDAK